MMRNLTTITEHSEKGISSVYTTKMKFLMHTALVAGFVVLGSTSSAFADCASPASPEGGLNYVDAATGFQYCDGTNWLDLGNSGSSLWTDNTTHISRSNFHILNTGLAAGSTTAGLDGNGIYAFYDPDKGVMRGGTISGGDDAWQDTVIGGNSFAWGLNAEALGGNSVAFGQSPVATGGGSVAMGIIPQALTYASVAIGYNVVSSGVSAMGIGSEMNLSGDDSRAFGAYLTTSGANSIALGNEATVSGTFSGAIGLGDSSAWPPPVVSGNNSLGVFMGDQNSIDLSDSNTVSFMGASGGFGIGTVSPAALLDVTGATTQLRLGTDATNNLEFLSNGNSFLTHNGGGNFYLRPDYDSEMIIDSAGGTWQPAANESFLSISTANTTADAPAAGGVSAVKISGGFEATAAKTYTGSLTGLDVTYTFGNGANATYNATKPITGLSVTPTINVNTASTRGYSAIYTNVTETSVSASGSNRLLDLRTNSYDTFSVLSNGTVTIDNDGNAGSNGCIRYDGTNSKLQFSHDCSTYSDMGTASSMAINDLSDAVTDYTTDHNMRIGSNTAMTSGAANNLFIGESAGTAGTTNDADNNIGIGYQSLNSNTTGSNNIALGPYALNENTTGGSSIAIGTSALGNAVSQMNIAIGNSALYNTTGIDNIAMGFYSLVNNSTGSNNIAFGNFTLDANTTGSYNVAFRSLGDNTTGDSNIALGQDSLGTNVANSESTAVGYNSMRYANDTATGVITYNTALGAYALRGSTTAADNTGTSNTAIGHSALLSNTGGSDNVAIGKEALTSANDPAAGNNVAIGSGAMHDALTNYNNVAIGQSAMSQAAAGYDNVAIGRFAGIEMEGNSNVAVGSAALIYGYGTSNSVAVGRAALSIATGDNNIALGHQAGDNITTGASNIMIGYDIDAASPTANSQLNVGDTIYGDLSTDRVAIGTSSQTASIQLKVAGTGGIMIPSGTDAQRPATGAAGMVRYNTTATPADTVEYYDAEGATWRTLLASGAGAVSAIDDLNDAITDYADGNMFLGSGNGDNVTTGTNNTSLGNNALAAVIDATGATAMGHNSLTVLESGTGNTAYGGLSLSGITSGSDNTAIGAAAGGALLGGQGNTAIGSTTMYSPSTRSYNTAVGFSAMEGGGSGGYNTALGVYALQSNSGKTESTAVGYGAMRYSDDAAANSISYNTAVGAYALQGSATAANNTGTSNTAIGHSALMSNTNGSTNIAIGASALKNHNGDGNSNIAIGVGSMENSDGDSLDGNVAVGLYTLSSNDGQYNVGIGYGAMISSNNSNSVAIGSEAMGNIGSSGGYGSVALGTRSLHLAAGADHNVALGFQTGDSLTTGDDNILIGYDVDTTSATSSSQLNIGNTIYGDLSTDQIAIGTATQTTDIQFKVSGTGGIMIPSGTDAQRPATGAAGMVRYNSTATPNDKIEYYDAESAGWLQLATGSGSSLWTDNTTHITRGNFHILNTGLAAGSTTAGLDGDGMYSFYDPDKGAMRGGEVAFGEAGWQDVNIGNDSFAWGRAPRASGLASVALGDRTRATGESSLAVGYDSYATNNQSIAMGDTVASNGWGSFAMGVETAATANHSVSFGLGDATGARPVVSGASSYGIFMGDQSGVDLATANTMAIMGGNVGIGTVSPNIITTANRALTISSYPQANSSAVIELHGNKTGANDGYAGLLFYNNNTAGASVVARRLSNDTSTALLFSTTLNGSSSERVRINPDGYVGILTSSPSVALDVGGTGGIRVPQGTNAQRPGTPAAGMVRYNTDATPNDKIEYYDAESAAWIQLAGGSSGSSVFEVASNVVRGVSGTVAYATDDFVFGSPQLADDTDATHDNRFWFDKSKGAFRAGGVTGAQWDDANVGDYSFAGGYNTEAGGYYAFAFGTGSDAAGYYSIAMGENNSAGATAAIVMGANSTASGSASVAIGSDSTASGDYSRAMGAYTVAAGDYSIAMGREVNISATGDGSMGIGLTTTSPATDPIVSGAQSFGIFMGDQSGVDLTQANTMALMGGRLGIGTVTPSVELEVTGDIEYTGTITDVSDMRLKDNIKPLIKTGSLLERIDQIDTYSFSMKDDKAKRIEFGVIAQELEKIFPELVKTAKDDMGTKSVNYVGLIAPMIEATKELHAENKEIKAALNDLNEQVALLNKIAGNKVSKASTENIWMLMFGLLCGIGGMLVLQRKNHNK